MVPVTCRPIHLFWRLSSRFLDYTGVFMLHCHMMNHEEMGMMQAVEVYKD